MYTYRYYCVTESKNISQQSLTTPTVCVNNSGHTIDLSSVTITHKPKTAAYVGLSNVKNILDNLTAITDPLSTDNSMNNISFSVGSKWINNLTGQTYTATNIDNSGNITWYIPGSKSWIFRDEKPRGTNGGDFTADIWQTRVLNTTTYTHGNQVIIDNSNNIILSHGTYVIRASAAANYVDNNQLRLFDVSNNTAVTYGTVINCGYGTSTQAALNYNVDIETANIYQIQHICASTRLIDGFGQAVGLGTEVYCEVVITKIK